jgi:hypothetical protein
MSLFRDDTVLRRPWMPNLFALLLYGAVSLVCWGLPLMGHWTTRYVGNGADPTNMFMWELAWLPHALRHGMNPFIIRDQWVPATFNAAWTTSILLPSLLLAPITLSAGPAASYNVLMLLGPAATAFATYMMIREIWDVPWLVGLWTGLLVGFSTFEVSQTMGHPFLTFAAFVPVGILLTVRIYRKRTGTPLWLIVGLAATIVGQFFTSTEMLATVTGFAVIAFVLATVLLRASRDRIVWTASRVALSYALAILVLSPLLVSMLGTSPFPSWVSMAGYSTNLLNLLIPTTASLGGNFFTHLSAPYSSDLAEASGYMGIPLIALVATFAFALRRQPAMRVLSYLLIVVVVASLGPYPQAGPRTAAAVPWAFLYFLPLTREVLPERLMFYAFLLAACLAAAYLSQAKLSRWRKWGVGAWMAFITVTLLPNLAEPFWWAPIRVPPLITSSTLNRYVAANETVLVLPFAFRGPGTFWQARSHFRFRLADGYLLPFLPVPWADNAMALALDAGQIPTSPQAPQEMREMIALGHVGEVLSVAPPPAALVRLMSRTRLIYQGVVGGVALWHVPKSMISPR